MFHNDEEVINYDDYDREYREHLRRELAEWEDSLKEKPKDDNGFSEELEAKTAALTEADMKHLLFRHCQNKRELYNWVKIFLRIDLPDTCVDPESTSNPLDMIWKLYETAVHYDKIEPAERHLKSLFYCSRGSFKTLGACVAELLIMIHAKRNTVHIGLIESQAKTAYDMYFRPFLDLPWIIDYVKKNSTLSRSELYNSEDASTITTLQVIPLTMNKTSSPRANLICKDEIDKTKGEQVMAYENAYGMLTMTNDKKMAMEFDISSRDSAYGKVQDLIDNADKTGCRVYHWNRIDITERCPDSRSGKKPIKIYVKQDSLSVLPEEDYLKLDKEERKNWDLEWGLDGCLKNCKMFAACKGYLKNQTSKCKWLKPVEETEKAILSAPSEEMAIAQLLCRLPPRTGLVYSDFNPKKNIQTAKQMFEQYTGTECPHDDFDTDDLIRLFKRDGLPCYIGVDAGFHNPACVLMYIDEDKNVYIVKEHMPHEVDSPELAQWLKDNWYTYMPVRTYVDVESPDAVRAVRKQGFVVPEKLDKSRQNGIATVKGFIKPPAENFTKLFVNKECMGIIYEFNRYAYKVATDGNPTDDAEKANDHALDAIRYILQALFGKNRGVLSQGHKPKPKKSDEQIKKEMVQNALTPQAVAAKIGHRVLDNRVRETIEEEERISRRSLAKYDPTEM